ncbi:hypothetical protein [Mycobacterium scrofulaceum]|uniref:hypothetical protein n=1 Tax=Mycobacterium scrofulaceum TaxID=1783 RepID=UPI001301FD4D|nr:hypothetical protein [Mycobacterium scrofulaceum]
MTPPTREVIRSGDRDRLIRAAARTGALIAASSFCRADAAARFDGFFARTATP